MFRVEGYTLADFAAALPDPTIGASFRPAFDANIAPWARYVEVHEGDACAIGWSGEPIEVLFLDMVKTWQLNDLVLAQFLPCLIPGRSVIVQQDYLWGYGHWIHLTMELLDGCVEQLDAMANGSVAYLLDGTDSAGSHRRPAGRVAGSRPSARADGTRGRALAGRRARTGGAGAGDDDSRARRQGVGAGRAERGTGPASRQRAGSAVRGNSEPLPPVIGLAGRRPIGPVNPGQRGAITLGVVIARLR